MLKRTLLLFLITMIFSSVYNNYIFVNASDYQSQNLQEQIYSVYDEKFNLIFQKDVVAVGDGYMSKDFKYYEVIFVDDENMMGIAKFVRDVAKPNVDISYSPKPINAESRVICMYMSHNDESYVPTDGVDSVYGNGGIRDVALAFKKQLENKLIDVYLDDTLHIPHDNYAYSRSKKTAENLYNKYKPDAIFDIHRDATSRKFYVANVNGKERGRIRIVIGKSNPNMSVNEEFALYLVSVANELYPWLITDIYYGGGHYNQGINGKALLFEMGTYLIEKELVIDSLDELAEVVTTALYNTTINENTGDLTINGMENADNITINDYIEQKETQKLNLLAISVVIVIMASVSLYAMYLFIKNVKQQKLLLKIKNSNKQK